MEERDTTKSPASSGKDEEERRLGRALSTIRKNLIKPYLALETEGEKAKYSEEHPELYEVLEIVTEIDLNSDNKKRMELAKLIREDITKTRIIEEARQIEAQYEHKTRTTGIGVGENNGE